VATNSSQWDGGAANESEGTVEWAGGYTDLNDAPFTMYVKNVTIEDYTTSGMTYSYGDETGSYTSIVVSNNTTETNTTLSSNSTIATFSGCNSSTSTSASSSSSTTKFVSSGIKFCGIDLESDAWRRATQLHDPCSGSGPRSFVSLIRSWGKIPDS
jgi:hypothetical protein